MASPAIDSKQHKCTTHERPWLVSWNRKLRHVHAIIVRNVALSIDDSRDEAKVIDDDALPSTLRQPTKHLALREARGFGHSRSSDDLRPIHEGDDNNVKSAPMGSPKSSAKEKKTRPAGRLRRRSTLDWSADSAQKRQSRLEVVSAERLADVFFSLHVTGLKEPIYISEVLRKTMNPTFQHIDWDDYSPGITRADSCRVKIWTRSGTSQMYGVLLDMAINLRSLQYIGKDLASFNLPLPQNCVIFQLTDGYYTCFNDMRMEEPLDAFAVTRSKQASARTVNTASFDALLRLAKLDDSIQDALALRERLSSDLSTIVGANHATLSEKDCLSRSRDYAKTISYAKSMLEKQLRSLKQKRDSRQATLQKRRELLLQGQRECSTMVDSSVSIRSESEQAKEDIARISRSIASQRRRLSADLSQIFDIEPVPDKALSFSIRSLRLPDSEDLDSAPPEIVAAALGHTTRMLQLLSFYLSQPLPYPPHPRSSTSSITDPISSLKPAVSPTNINIPNPYLHTSPSATAPKSLTDPSRTFPLYSRASGPKFRFEYALFLLNKNIQVLLANAFGIRVLDIRQTLPNLAYVLACMGAGEGELPSRKAGGVRGLLQSTARDAADMSMGNDARQRSRTKGHDADDDQQDGGGTGDVDVRVNRERQGAFGGTKTGFAGGFGRGALRGVGRDGRTVSFNGFARGGAVARREAGG